jgi:hypothetical protein
MPFAILPRTAAWQHQHSRLGLEVVFLAADESGYRLNGHTVAVEGTRTWVVQYEISLDSFWTTKAARVSSWSVNGKADVTLDAHESGHWRVNGRSAPEYDGCIDIDLESSACTNTIPVHRLSLGIGQSANVPALYVTAVDLGVERLEQEYCRIDDLGKNQRYDYRAPAFDFESQLVYDHTGLVMEYPGIASRIQ